MHQSYPEAPKFHPPFPHLVCRILGGSVSGMGGSGRGGGPLTIPNTKNHRHELISDVTF
jgi:hypothetical protein